MAPIVATILASLARGPAVPEQSPANAGHTGPAVQEHGASAGYTSITPEAMEEGLGIQPQPQHDGSQNPEHTTATPVDTQAPMPAEAVQGAAVGNTSPATSQQSPAGAAAAGGVGELRAIIDLFLICFGGRQQQHTYTSPSAAHPVAGADIETGDAAHTPGNIGADGAAGTAGVEAASWPTVTSLWSALWTRATLKIVNRTGKRSICSVSPIQFL